MVYDRMRLAARPGLFLELIDHPVPRRLAAGQLHAPHEKVAKQLKFFDDETGE